MLHTDLNIFALLDTGATRNFIGEDLNDKLDDRKLILGKKKWKRNILAANENPVEISRECRVKIRIHIFDEFNIWTNS